MRIEGASLIYIQDTDTDTDSDATSWQADMRLIVRPLEKGAVFVEIENESTASQEIMDENQWYFECKPDEAREIAASLILAAEAAEAITQQGEKT